MKKISKFTIIPNSFWSTPDLSLEAKWVAVSIDSFSDKPQGVAIGTTALSSDTNLTVKQVKEALKELQIKGALDVNVGENGEKHLKVYLYKEYYKPRGEKIVIGDKPTDTTPLPYDEIMNKWNEYCPMLPKLTRMTPQRKNKLRGSLKQADLTVEDLYKIFRIVGSCEFLNGSSNQFKSNFDWVTAKSTTLTKIYEGFYARSYQEKRDYEMIMNGATVNQRGTQDDFYR